MTRKLEKKSIETVVIHFRLILTASQVYMTCKMLQPQLILEYSPPDWQLASDTKRITIEWLTNEYMLFFSFPLSAVVHRSPSTGNLYFANIQKYDGRGGKNYVCIVSNAVLRGLVQGDDQKIEPKQSTGNCGNRSGATHEKNFLLHIYSSVACACSNDGKFSVVFHSFAIRIFTQIQN